MMHAAEYVDRFAKVDTSAAQLCSATLKCIETSIVRLDPRQLRVITVNKKLLFRDFPGLKFKDPEFVDQWLIDQAGWMRRSQILHQSDRVWFNLNGSCDRACRQNALVEAQWQHKLQDGWWPSQTHLRHGRPALNHRSPRAIVPFGYGRAMVLPVDDGSGVVRCMDSKGSGTEYPRAGSIVLCIF